LGPLPTTDLVQHLVGARILQHQKRAPASASAPADAREPAGATFLYPDDAEARVERRLITGYRGA
jgi:hypothetical protein